MFFLNAENIPLVSNDNRTNAFGDRLLELCRARDLRICNSRIGSNSSVGKFMCFTYNGESVVDYMWARYNYFDHIMNFCVQGFAEFSNQYH